MDLRYRSYCSHYTACANCYFGNSEFAFNYGKPTICTAIVQPFSRAEGQDIMGCPYEMEQSSYENWNYVANCNVT